jgi:acylphosphatase
MFKVQCFRCPKALKNTLRKSLFYGFFPSCQHQWVGNFPPGTMATVAYCSPESAVNRRQMQVLYSGHVQGVGFRYTVKSVANGFVATGTIRNLPDGRVELVAQGASDELDAFRKAIRESGLDRFIRSEEVHWSEASSQFRGFEIIS